jgi:ribosomal protein L27
MRTMYVPGSETHVHNNYIIGHHHTMLKINSGKVFYYIKMSKTSTESIT